MKKSILTLILAFGFASSEAYGQNAGNPYSYICTRTFTGADTVSHFDRVAYDNGLGSLCQEISVATTPRRKSLVVLHEHDMHGRPLCMWLPAVTDGDAAVTDTTALKAAARLSAGGDSRPYATTLDQGFPLAPKRQFGPGDAWYKADRAVRITERVVTEGMGSTYGLLGLRIIYGNMLIRTGFQTGCHLYTETVDEDGNRLIEVRDEEGRLLLSRRTEGLKFFSTYYVYDDAGRLRYVFPPELEETLMERTTWPVTVTDEIFGRYATSYLYDGRGNCIRKRLPGVEHVEYVYDEADRLIFSQDGNQRARTTENWTYYKYDAFGRLTEQGVCTDRITASGTVAHIRNYYDDYAFVGSAGFGDSRFTADVSGHGKGLLTGQTVAVDGMPAPLCKAFYYDARGREVRRVESNLAGGYEVFSTAYTFTDRPLSVTHTHTVPGRSLTEVTTYAYDHADRLTLVRHRLDNGAPVTLAEYGYDEMGRMQSKKRGGGVHVSAYAYNVRGWLTNITGTHFSQNLHYHTGIGVPRYNGNISGMTWQSGSEEPLRGYTFTYDGQNRLLSATYGEKAAMDVNRGRFSEQVMEYDKNGNIRRLLRHGPTSASTYGLVDSLTYTLAGNRLRRVDDGVSSAPYGDGSSFRDGARQADEYAYDANGNLIKDLNKNLLHIRYNSLNLPVVMSFASGDTVSCVYAADGTKLRMFVRRGSVTSTTDYCGGVIYENGTPVRLLTEGGYVTLHDNAHHFQVEDHQGNVRVVVDGKGRLEEINHYYPLGGLFGGTPGVQPYKYNGKELCARNVLDWYDYGARYYDASLGRWHTLDPLAEKSPAMSPYVYCADNPVRYIDPTGEIPIETIWDIGNVLYDLGSAVFNHIKGDHQAAKSNWVDFGLDVGAMLTPYVPAGTSKGLKAGTAGVKVLDGAVDGAKTTDRATDVGKAGKTIAKENGVTIKSYGTNDVHKPAHAHVKGGGHEIRIGPNGKPLKGQSELSEKQKKVVDSHRKEIRKEINAVGRENKRIEELNKKR